jgi:hypothetical protein
LASLSSRASRVRLSADSFYPCFWDKQFVETLGRPPAAVANQLLAQVTPE